MDILPFISKYIPKKLDDIVGNENNIAYIKKYIQNNYYNNIIITGPCGTGKTTTANCFIHDYKINDNDLLVLNMSDIRGIDIVNNKISSFLDKKTTKNNILTLILDEIDNLTIRAQYSIRELMEKYNHKARFIFICSSTTNIIENLQSKCTILSYKKQSHQDLIHFLSVICKKENLFPTDCGLDALAFISNGDIRIALNYLQEISIIYKSFNKDHVYEICDYPPPVTITAILKHCENNNIPEIIKSVDQLYSDGYSFYDLIQILFKILKKYPINEEKKLIMIKELGYGHVRNASGTHSNLQILRVFILFAKILNSGK